MPPISCTSKWRMSRTRRPAPRPTARASGRSWSGGWPRSRRSLSCAVMPRSSASLLAFIAGSSSLMRVTWGPSFFSSRAFLVPKIFLIRNEINGLSAGCGLVLARLEVPGRFPRDQERQEVVLEIEAHPRLGGLPAAGVGDRAEEGGEGAERAGPADVLLAREPVGLAVVAAEGEPLAVDSLGGRA